MMNKRRSKYCEFRSIDELQKERKRLHKMMILNEAYLQDDWEEIKYRLSPSTILEEVRERIISSSTFLQKVIAGARAGISMMQNRKARRGGCSCGCGDID